MVFSPQNGCIFNANLMPLDISMLTSVWSFQREVKAIIVQVLCNWICFLLI